MNDRFVMYVYWICRISSLSNFQTIDYVPGNDVTFPLYLPSYAAAAWYHKRLPPDLQQLTLKDVLSHAEAFSSGEYLLALARGDAVPQADQDRVASHLSRFTGLDACCLTQESLRSP